MSKYTKNELIILSVFYTAGVAFLMGAIIGNKWISYIGLGVLFFAPLAYLIRKYYFNTKNKDDKQIIKVIKLGEVDKDE